MFPADQERAGPGAPRLSLLLAPADRVSRERVRSYAAALGTTIRSVALAIQVARLYDAIRYMHPERDWMWLRAIKKRLEANAQPAARPALPFDGTALQDLGFQLMAEAEVRLLSLNMDDRRGARAIAELHRDGVLIALASLGTTPRLGGVALSTRWKHDFRRQ
jgi:hypothetical protein